MHPVDPDSEGTKHIQWDPALELYYMCICLLPVTASDLHLLLPG